MNNKVFLVSCGFPQNFIYCLVCNIATKLDFKDSVPAVKTKLSKKKNKAATYLQYLKAILK